MATFPSTRDYANTIVWHKFSDSRGPYDERSRKWIIRICTSLGCSLPLVMSKTKSLTAVLVSAIFYALITSAVLRDSSKENLLNTLVYATFVVVMLFWY